MRLSSHVQKKGETAHGMRRPALFGAHAQADVYPNRPFRAHIAADVFPESAVWAHVQADAYPNRPFTPPSSSPPLSVPPPNCARPAFFFRGGLAGAC